MGTDPRGRADGEFANLPNFGAGGVAMASGTFLPPSSRVIYVRSTGTQSGDPVSSTYRPLPTLAAALARCRAGLADTIYILPGHTENVTDATMFTGAPAGLSIIGVGRGANRPTFRWTATTSQWAIASANISISGLRLRLEGAAVVKAINITGADVSLVGNDIEFGSAVTTNVAAIAIEVGTGATRCTISKNEFRATAASASADCILIVGTAVDGVKIVDNVMMGSCTAANGLIRCTAAATNLFISRNTIFNSLALSSAGIAFANVAATGACSDNDIVILNTGTATSGSVGIVTGGASNLVGFFRNLVCNDPQTSGVLKPTADT